MSCSAILIPTVAMICIDPRSARLEDDDVTASREA
jgi:hypothetical protein